MGYVIGIVLLGYLSIVLLVWAFQKKLIYYPSAHLFQDPAAANLNYRDVTFRSGEEFNLHGWYIPHDDARATLLFFHGNAGNISGRVHLLRKLHDAGFSTLIFDYRGYGRSQGTPSEEGTYRDAKAAWEFLTGELEIPASRIVLFGRSLGGAVAAWLATQTDPAGLILESTFISAARIGADVYPFLPVRKLIRFEYNTAERIKKLKIPILIAHSREDELIPFEHGKALYEMAQEPKYFLEMQGGHANGYAETGAEYLQALRDFAQRAVGQPPQAGSDLKN
ncbi:MAG: alpha/beta fold hydrolase [Balneolaceae bacterium]|nr:alpha/beta fold hydrolase [Balneolaceae bacterium]